jgi:hypothetical protein
LTFSIVLLTIALDDRATKAAHDEPELLINEARERQEGLAALRIEVERENRLCAPYTIAGPVQVALGRGDS